jgi:homoserine dehydrogenase
MEQRGGNRLGVGICGLGTVGASVLQLLQQHESMVCARAQCALPAVHVGTRQARADLQAKGVSVSEDLFAVAADPAVQVLVETVGGTGLALELVEAALDAGKHVVTANKALIAEHGNALFARAAANGVGLRFEAAVAGGIPLIKTLREGLAANRVDWLAGIINGTANFILSEMAAHRRPFAEVLAEAQALGYAEADPTFDIEGIDAAHKLVILAAIAFGMPLRFDAVYTEGISALAPEDLVYAAELGYRIKHLGIARQSARAVELRVHPTLLPAEQLLARVDGVQNAILIDGDAVGQILCAGAGAGGAATASAVVADLIDLGRQFGADASATPPSLGIAADALVDLPVLPMAEVCTAWYLRLQVMDRPGVMSQLSSILGAEGISIEALIQKAPRQGAADVPVVVLTNVATQRALERAVLALEGLESVLGRVTRIRVETLQD